MFQSVGYSTTSHCNCSLKLCQSPNSTQNDCQWSVQHIASVETDQETYHRIWSIPFGFGIGSDETRKGSVSSMLRSLSIVVERFFAKPLHLLRTIFPSVLDFLECCAESFWFLAEYLVLTLLVSTFADSLFPADVVGDARNQVLH